MLSVDTISMGSIANTVSESANIHGLRDPSSGNTTEESRKTVDVLRGGATVGVDVAGETAAVLRVADKEDALDGGHGGAGDAGHGVYGGGGALGVALEDEAHVGVGGEGSGDLVDNLRMWMLAYGNLIERSEWQGGTYVCGTQSRVLAGVGKVDGVVDGAAGNLSESVLVHGSEASRGTLKFSSSTCRDDGVARASSTLLDGVGDGTCSEEDAEESTLEADVGEHGDENDKSVEKD
jgi:hypothetical protein